jgi:hypothetical protein
MEMRVTGLLNDLNDHQLHASASNKIVAIISEIGRARTLIDQKNAQLKNAAGLPIGGVESGVGDGYHRRYQNGIIYYLPPRAPCWVHGAILGKYLDLGADGGLLGYPTTDELTTPDGLGRYNHFERGSIYWTYRTGAHEVHGAIRDKWASLGWERSWLGFPTSNEMPFAQDGRVSLFENGAIYWWPDTGAIPLGNIVVRYRGLYCFGESEELSSADEPYVVFGVVPSPPTPPSQVRTQIYDDVDSGNARPDNMELYRGVPCGMVLAIAMCEHDDGDPNAYLDQVKQGVGLVGKAVSTGCGALFGPEAAPVCESIWNQVAPTIVSAVNGALGTGDDLIAKTFWNLTAKEMVTQVGLPLMNWWGIQYHRETELLSDGDASYKAYFSIEHA